MMQTNTKKSQTFITLMALIMILGCKSTGDKFGSPDSYDFSKPEKFILPNALHEISGLAFNNLDPSTIYSLQDENGGIFSQQWANKKALSTKFAGRGDFEDLAILSDTIFVLKSNGTIYSFPLSELGKKQADHVKEWKKLVPKGEFESLYADEAASELVLLCKDEELGDKKYQTTGYVLKYDGSSRKLELKETFILNTKAVKRSGSELTHGLRPSALSRNPVTKDWYILSAVNKILVVADPDWNIKSVYRLHSNTFNQPEGLAFDKDQNLYISNEGDEVTNGNILKFVYKEP
jgi:DNA-binding beta-propeller fold protein YncE